MQTIGLLGGMSWMSTITYYRGLNEGIQARRGGWHSAKICLYSVDFDEIEKLQHRDDWAATAKILTEAAGRVVAGGADFLMLCTNTMHRVVPEIETKFSIPVLHIADATAGRLIDDGIRKVGLLGTRFTMEQAFYRERLEKKYGIEVQIPDEPERAIIHQVIYDELCHGHIRDDSRAKYLKIIDQLTLRGAEAIVLGCTEIGLLVEPVHTSARLYDTTQLHIEAAVSRALGG